MQANKLAELLGALLITHVMLMLVCVVLALGSVAMAVLFIISVWQERGIEVKGHWGGFGSNSGGWWLSRSLSFLFASLAFASLLALVSLSNSLRPEDKPADKHAAEIVVHASSEPAVTVH